MSGERPASAELAPDAPNPRFNGAPDRCPGRVRERPCPLEVLLTRPRFNGAPARCPGRVESVDDASSAIASLQRSPGSMSGESRSGDLNAARPSITASTEPGSMSGERTGATERHQLACETIRSASTEPRLDVRGEADTSEVLERGAPLQDVLQRSPGSMSGERLVTAQVGRVQRGCFNGAPARCPERLSLRRRARRSRQAVAWSSSFNGAPARCPGRAEQLALPVRRATSGRMSAALQRRWACRCPGELRLVRNSSWRRASHIFELGFNGAPARCPGESRAGGVRRSTSGRNSLETVAGRSPGSMCPGESQRRPRHDQLVLGMMLQAEPPARCPGRAMSRRCRPSTHERLAIVASTEPRLDVRESNRLPAPSARPDARLQRSPGSMSGESLMGAAARVRSGSAIRLQRQGPRLDVRGEVDCGGARHRFRSRFQRSPGSMSGERRVVGR